VAYQKDLRTTALFDLKVDPEEKRNLIHTPQGAQQAENWKRELERLRIDTGYRFDTRG